MPVSSFVNRPSLALRACDNQPLLALRARDNRSRSGFTLIELMVAMALTLFVMVILTQAFVTSLAAFSALKAIGEMQANLRTASSLLQADLASDHFEGNRRLSSPDLQTLPPRQGFFYIYQGSTFTVSPLTPYQGNGPIGYLDEGYETVAPWPPKVPGLESYRACNHVLYFTSRLRGNRPENFMTVTLPPGSPLSLGGAGLNDPTAYYNQPLDATYLQPGNTQAGTGTGTNFFSGQWAEICWFLVQTGSTVEPANPKAITGTPLFSLYRAQYLPVMNPLGANAAVPAAASYANLSTSNPSNAANFLFNAPDDLAKPASFNLRTLNVFGSPFPYPYRPSDFQATPAQSQSTGLPPSGSTLVLSNVTSFQVQVYTNPLQVDAGNNPIADFVDLSLVPANFPAAYDSSVPPYNILAVKVTIRIWDPSSQLSRQITIIQDM